MYKPNPYARSIADNENGLSQMDGMGKSDTYMVWVTRMDKEPADRKYIVMNKGIDHRDTKEGNGINQWIKHSNGQRQHIGETPPKVNVDWKSEGSLWTPDRIFTGHIYHTKRQRERWRQR